MRKSRAKAPALEINTEVLNHVNTLSDQVRGIALRWMITTLNGNSVSVEDERHDIGERFDSVCLKLMTILDADKFEQGQIVIQFVCEHLERHQRISHVRSKARATRETNKRSGPQPKAMPASAIPAVAPKSKTKDKAKPPAQSPKISSHEALEINPAQAERLQAMGVSAKQAATAIGRLTKEYGESAVSQAIDRMQQRKLAKPIAYLETSLANSRREHTEAMPLYIKAEASPDSNLPRGLRRHQRVPPGSPYQFLGWTCANHPRASDGIRRKIWRTDSGSLAYKRAEANETIPDFNEDAGCYEEE